MNKNKTSTIKTYFKVHIHEESQAKEFLDRLYKDGLMYHPEDDAHDITTNEGMLFTADEADLLNERMDEIWGILDDPCEYVLELIKNIGPPAIFMTNMNKNKINTTKLIEELESKLKSHDWFYEYSDDNRYYKAGQKEFLDIWNVIEQLQAIGEDEFNQAITLYLRHKPIVKTPHEKVVGQNY